MTFVAPFFHLVVVLCKVRFLYFHQPPALPSNLLSIQSKNPIGDTVKLQRKHQHKGGFMAGVFEHNREAPLSPNAGEMLIEIMLC